MPRTASFFWLFCCFLLAFSPISAQPVSPKTITDLTTSAEVWLDPTGQQSLSIAQKQAYARPGTPILNFGFSPHTVWLRLTLRQSTAQPADYMLQLTNWYLDEADLYSPQPDGSYALQQAGDFIPLRQRAIKSRYPTFTVRLPNNRPHLFYIRLTNTQYNNFRLKLWPRAQFYDVVLSGDSADFSLGLMAMRLAFHIALLLFLFSDVRFRAYSFFGISVCLIYFFSGGNGSIIFPGSPWLANGMFFFGLSLIPASLSWYIYVVMEGDTYLPRARWLVWLFGGIGLLNLMANLVGHHAYLSWAFIAFMSLMLLCLALMVSLALYRGSRPVVWYLIPALLYIPPFCLFYARNAGLHSLPFSEEGIRVIFFLEFLSLPFILTALLRNIYRERFTMVGDLSRREAESHSLRQLDRAKTRFFTNVSHEFRTPLTLLVGPLNDLREQFPANELYGLMHRNAHRLQTLTNQLLDLAKVDAGQMTMTPQPGDLVADLRLWVASFESLAERKRIGLSLTQNQSEYPARYDTDKLETIITNLLSNALKFTNEGGQVRMEGYYKAEVFTLTVTDTGPGIAPDDLPHIFDRFYQQANESVHTRPDQVGTGVGLALVQELTHLLGGTIGAESTLGEGATFTLTMPLESFNGPVTKSVSSASFSTLPASSEQNTLNEPQSATSDSPTLLIVEDNDDLRAYIRHILTPDYTILEAPDGQQGLETALDQLPDLIVCDVMMPRLDGFGLCAALRADVRTSHIPVVMLTALATQSDRLTGLETGADDYLTKPFDRAELRIRVQNLLKRQATLRQYLRGQLEQTSATLTSSDRSTPSELPAIAPTEAPFLNKLYQYIEVNLDSSTLDVNQLALEAAMSSRTLNRKLTALLGLTANDLIRSYRMSRAAELLRSGLTPSETAYRVGFDNLSYFSRVFREEQGKTPSEYAQKGSLSENQQDLSEN
jgi:signal transduction histidine kinase/DNA-binding response OmpR family regulator